MKPRTAAEQQIELLRQMKESRSKRNAAPPPAAMQPVHAQQPKGQALPAPAKAGEGARPARPKAQGPALPVSREAWQRLRQRQADTKEFRSRRDMGDWAAALLLALPPGAHALGEDARAELLRRLAEWAEARGLRP